MARGHHGQTTELGLHHCHGIALTVAIWSHQGMLYKTPHLAHELRHPVELDFSPEGVRCTLLVPVREPSEFELRRKGPAAVGR